MTKTIIIATLYASAIIISLRELYIGYKMGHLTTKFNLKAFIIAILVFSMFLGLSYLLFNDFIRWLLE